MNPYSTLGVPNDADPAKINKAYRRKASQLHPDRNPGDTTAIARFRDVADAYAILNDPDRRARYDATGETNTPPSIEVRAIRVWVEALSMAIGAMTEHNDENSNVYELMRDAIRNGIDKVRKDLRMADRQRKAMKKQIGRFTKKEGENVLEQIIANQLRQADVYAKAMSEKLEEMEWALEHLGEYSYKAPRRAPVRSASVTSPEALYRFYVQ